MSQPVASTSSSVPGAGEEQRPEAGPLPQKVGEFGYDSAIHGRPSGEMREVDLGAPISMPARHPADRDAVTASESSPTTNSPTTAANRPTEAPSPAASVKKRVLGNGVIGGISFGTLFRLFFIIAAIAGTGVAWYFTIQKFTQDAEEDAKAAAPPPEQESDQDIINPFPFQSIIFVHVAFTIIVIFEFLFLERGIFHARAERYIFVNGMSPRALTNASMGIAPWNRPPLPTYAAALAESGVGTGDVEDNMIAILPPPAYGNTRGSTLLLSSMLPASLVRTFSRASNRSDSPQERRRSQEAEMEEGRRSRPISYGASQEVDDAHRARELEDALSKLERNRSRPA